MGEQQHRQSLHIQHGAGTKLADLCYTYPISFLQEIWKEII